MYILTSTMLNQNYKFDFKFIEKCQVFDERIYKQSFISTYCSIDAKASVVAYFIESFSPVVVDGFFATAESQNIFQPRIHYISII